MYFFFSFFFLNDTPPPEISPLPLHAALPIWLPAPAALPRPPGSTPPASRRRPHCAPAAPRTRRAADRKSTRLNSSHANISYAVFCLKKKKQTTTYHNYANTKTYLHNTTHNQI